MEKMRLRRLGAQAWRGLLARFAESGLTAAAFCEREGISSKSFYRWRSRLSRSPDQAQLPHETPSVRSAESGFIDLGALRAGNSRLELRLDLGGGVLLHLVRE
jgi:putative transposase